MAKDIESLTQWLIGMLTIAGFFSTAFPIVYSFSPWYKSRLGRALMIQAIAFALALDLTLIFHFWTPTNILVIFWTNAVIFTLIAGATAYLTWKMLKHNLYLPMLKKQHEKKENTNVGADSRGV